MKKSYLLVAALLMSGAATTFTSCIDTTEPAGITDMRGAKAELLRAKAQVELAEAAIKNAQAAWVQAKADYEAEKAKQEAFQTQIKEAQTKEEVQRIEEAMKLSEEQFKADLLAKQQATAEAQAEYDKALIAIEAELVGYKENVYANELMELLNSNTYTVTYTDANGVQQTQTMRGLKGINDEIKQANEELAQLMRELSKLEFSYDINTKIAAAEGQLAIEKGKLEGLQKDLENLKVITGKPYEEWDAQYKEFEAKEKELENKKGQLDVEKQEALKPVSEEEKAQQDAAIAESELAFTIPAAVQNDFANILSNVSINDFNDWKVTDADGKVTFPNGVKASMTMSDKDNTLESIIGDLEQNWVLDAEGLALAQADLVQKKQINDVYWTEGTGTYYVDLKAWSDALKAYQDLFNAGNYADANNNARAVIMKAFNNLDQTNATAVTAFRGQLKTYLAERTKIDGFKIGKTADPDTAIDPTNDTDWAQWLAIGADDDKYGSDITNSINHGGAYKKYLDAANKLGYNYAINPVNGRQTEYTYEEYIKDGVSSVVTNGTAKVAFDARKDYEEVNSKITNKADWDKLYADLQKLEGDNQKALDELNLAKAETAAKKDKIKAEYIAKSSAINVELVGLQNIMSKIEAIFTDAGATGNDYDEILQDLKDKIAQLESGTVNDSGNDYIFNNANNSIPVQEAVVASYEKLIAALKDGSYKPEEDNRIELKKAEIEAQNELLAALDVVFKQVSAKKDALMAVLTGE